MSYDPILAVIAIIFGILIIVFKELLQWIVGIFFILLGIWLLIEYMGKTTPRPQQPQQQPPEQGPKQ